MILFADVHRIEMWFEFSIEGFGAHRKNLKYYESSTLVGLYVNIVNS